MHVVTTKVWAQQIVFGRNVVRQLLVPSGTLDVVEAATGLEVASVQGRWPAIQAGGGEPVQLTAVIPTVRTGGRVGWIGDTVLRSPQTVLASFVDGIGFRDHAEPHALRRPQIGALHSVIGYWASGVTAPGIVVMPTGTGKTETMLALLVAARPERLLVLVPTAALRDQIAAKFESLGILHTHQIVTPSVMRPVVGKLQHGFHDASNAAAFASACNVVVATPHALQACEPGLATPCWPRSVTWWSMRPTTHRRPAGHALSTPSPIGVSCCSPPPRSERTGGPCPGGRSFGSRYGRPNGTGTSPPSTTGPC